MDFIQFENLGEVVKLIQSLSTYILTGGYQIPIKTLTGDPETDVLFIDKCIGVGEVAISDHRGSGPGRQEIIDLASRIRRGGILGICSFAL